MRDKQPLVQQGGGRGVQAQRKVLPVKDKRPAIRGGISTGQGVQVQRDTNQAGPYKKEKAVDQVIFSPACVPVPTDPQLGFGW